VLLVEEEVDAEVATRVAARVEVSEVEAVAEETA